MENINIVESPSRDDDLWETQLMSTSVWLNMSISTLSLQLFMLYNVKQFANEWSLQDVWDWAINYTTDSSAQSD